MQVDANGQLTFTLKYIGLTKDPRFTKETRMIDTFEPENTNNVKILMPHGINYYITKDGKEYMIVVPKDTPASLRLVPKAQTFAGSVTMVFDGDVLHESAINTAPEFGSVEQSIATKEGDRMVYSSRDAEYDIGPDDIVFVSGLCSGIYDYLPNFPAKAVFVVDSDKMAVRNDDNKGPGGQGSICGTRAINRVVKP